MNPLKIKTTLNRKEPEYRLQECIIEKSIGVSHDEFETFRRNLLKDNPHIQKHRDLMYKDDKNNYHCLLIYDEEQGDGVLIESEGANYARYSQYIPNAKLLIKQHEMTQIQEMKFYCPLKITLDSNKMDSDEFEEILDCEAIDYETEINKYLENFILPEEKERGLMHWYYEENSISKKVQSAFMSVEAINNQLYGVVTATIRGELTTNELKQFSEYCVGQMSDGWGEVLEQKPIKTPDGEIYVSFWNNSYEYYFKQEREIFETQEDLNQNFGMSLSM